MTDAYTLAKARLDAAQHRLKRWDVALRDPRKFKPLMKIEWDNAFNAREAAVQAACRADPMRFISDYPSWAWLAVYLGLAAATEEAA